MSLSYQKQFEEQRRKRIQNGQKRQAAKSKEITYFKQILGLKSTTPQTVVLKAIREHVDMVNKQVNAAQSAQGASSIPQAQQQQYATSASSSPLPVSPGVDSNQQFIPSVKSEVLEIQDSEVVVISNGEQDASSSHVNDRSMGNDITISYDGYTSESSESTRSSLPQRKRQRPHNYSSNQPSTSTSATKIELKDVMEILTERGAQTSDKTKDHDEDGLFLSSITPALKRMKPKRRYEVKMKIMKLIYDAEFDSQD